MKKVIFLFKKIILSLMILFLSISPLSAAKTRNKTVFLKAMKEIKQEIKDYKATGNNDCDYACIKLLNISYDLAKEKNTLYVIFETEEKLIYKMYWQGYTDGNQAWQEKKYEAHRE